MARDASAIGGLRAAVFFYATVPLKQPQEEMMKAWQAILIVGVLISAAIWFREPQEAQAQLTDSVAKCALENLRVVGSDAATKFIMSACRQLR